MLLSILVMLGVVFIVVFMLIPQIEQTVGRIANVFPDYMTTVELWWNNLAGHARVLLHLAARHEHEHQRPGTEGGSCSASGATPFFEYHRGHHHLHFQACSSTSYSA